MRVQDITRKIAIGTVQFGLNYGISNKAGQTPLTEVKAILQTASTYGINTLDTAYSYGTSEEVLGNAGCEGFNIISKFPKNVAEKGINFCFAETTRRLKQTKLYGYIAHSSDSLINNQELWNDLLKLKETGQVKKIGVSLYLPEEIDSLLSLGLVPDLVQVPFNALDKRFLPKFGELKKLGVEIHTRSAYLQGLFFIPAKSLNSYFEPIKPAIELLQTKYMSDKVLSSALLHHCLAVKEIDKVVIGLNNVGQLLDSIDNFKYGIENPLPLTEIAANLPVELERFILPVNWPDNL